MHVCVHAECMCVHVRACAWYACTCVRVEIVVLVRSCASMPAHCACDYAVPELLRYACMCLVCLVRAYCRYHAHVNAGAACTTHSAIARRMQMHMHMLLTILTLMQHATCTCTCNRHMHVQMDVHIRTSALHFNALHCCPHAAYAICAYRDR